MKTFGEPEFNRECRRLLRGLSKGAVLHRGRDGGYVSTGRIKASADLAAALAQRGLLERAGPDAYKISQAGLLWHLRHIPAPADGNAFADRHRQLATRETTDDGGAKIRVRVNLMESPMAFLHARGLVSPAQFEAGERLRADYEKAHMSPHLCVDLSAVGRSGQRGTFRDTYSDVVLAAKERFRKAMSAAGPGLSDVLYDVCCDLKGLEAIEKGRAWPRSSGKVVLRLALDRLVAHYGLNVVARHASDKVWIPEKC